MDWRTYSEERGHDATNDRAMVERALYARAERLARVDRRDHRLCYHCDRDGLVPFADGGLALCVNCHEFVYPS
jgi:hypothetical protein